MSVLRFASPAQATDTEALAALTGPIRTLERSSLETVGFTAARHERLVLTLRTGERRTLVVKRTRPSTDWTACRTSDRRGREAAMLGEPTLDPIWEAYRALLEARIPGPLPDARWEALVRAGILIGARMLLWSKALAVEADRPGAKVEWSWWIDRLGAAYG